jgi:hypothetical protein
MNEYLDWNTFNGDWYIENHTVIEFLVLSILFISLIWATVRKNFPDRAGKILSITIGVGLAIGLNYVMSQWNVTFMDLGWISVGLLTIVLGLVIFSLVKDKSLGIVGTLGMILLVVAVVGQKTEPIRRFSEPIHLDYILPVFLLVFLIYFLAKSVPHEKSTSVPPATTEEPIKASSSMFKTTRAQILQSRWLADQIKKIRAYVSSGTTDSTDRHALEAAIVRINQIETDLAVRLKRMEELAKHLEHKDTMVYGELAKFIAAVQKAGNSPESRKLMLQKSRLSEEGTVYELIHRAIHHVRHIKHALEKADDFLKKDNIDRSHQWLDRALKRQEELTTLLTELAKWEERLKSLTEIPVK